MKIAVSTLILALFISPVSGCDDSSSKASTTCGNGRLDSKEVCDGIDLGGATCESLGFRQGLLACTASCDLDLSDCASWGRCGDGVLQDAVEQCDRLQLGFSTCGSLGYHGGELDCDEACRFDTSGCDDAGICGDGILQAEFERCDTTVPETITCESVGRYTGMPLCTDACEIDYSGCRGFCGDGEFWPEHEDCEPLLPGTTTCTQLGYWTGAVGCDAQCAFDAAGCLAPGVITLGGESIFALDSGGNAWGWGWSDGGLGQPVLQHYATPMPISLPGDLSFNDISTFDLHSCAVDRNRNAWCWGANSSGQLGNGSTTLSYTPVAVRMPTGVYFDAVTVGYDHSCGLGNNGAAYCWGANGFGQLGNGNTVSSQTPTMAVMPAGVTFTRLEAGFQFNCAIGTNGQIYCWGRNDTGQLGVGNTTNRTQPTPVTLNGVSFTNLDCGYSFTCGITTIGSLYCWGRNESGQLGLGDTAIRLLPALRAEPAGVLLTKLALGGSYGCASSTTGRLWCWGWNYYGQLGMGTTTGTLLPVEIAQPGGRLVMDVSAGASSTCVKLHPGLLACWGLNGQAQFGFPATPVLSPVLVPGP